MSSTTKSRRTKSIAATVGAAAAVAGLALTTGVSADASVARTAPGATTKHDHGGTKPTIVFVHGAWADASGFTAEIDYFRHRGYPVTTIANPLRGVISDGNYVRDRLKTIKGPIVLAGHSYGGAVITNAATGVPNVKQLVYLAAFAPDQGETVANVVPASKYLTPNRLDMVPVANPYAKDGKDVDLYIKPEFFADIFAGDVSKQNALDQAATQRPLANTGYTQPSGVPAWKTIPTSYLITLNDHAIPPSGQQFMAKRMNAHIETVRSSHDVMISHPRAVESIVLRAAKNVR